MPQRPSPRALQAQTARPELDGGIHVLVLQGSPSTGRQLSAALQQVIVASVQAEVIRRRMTVRHPPAAADDMMASTVVQHFACSIISGPATPTLTFVSGAGLQWS